MRETYWAGRGGSFRAPTSGGSGGPGDEPIPIGRDAIAWAARDLPRYEMPRDEISAVLGAAPGACAQAHGAP
jgi:hypothetical protein